MGDYQGDYLVRFMAKIQYQAKAQVTNGYNLSHAEINKNTKKTDNSAMSALNKYKNDIAQRGTTQGDYLKV